jgi:DNA helicase IV
MGILEWILDIIFPNRYKEYQIKLSEEKTKIETSYQELKELYEKPEYLTKRTIQQWKNRWSSLNQLLNNYKKRKRGIDEQTIEKLDFLYAGFYEQTFSETRNRHYIEEEITRNREYFNKLEKFPLTPKQCQAIVVDESRNLVIAGAGTGKTSTLVGKVGYILRKDLAKPEEILLLSFGKDIRDEMLERTKKRFGIPVQVNTFHSLGMKIISEHNDHKPSVSKLSTDNAYLTKFIEGVVDEKLSDPVFLKNLNTFSLRLPEYKTEWDFKSLSDYVEYVKSQHLRSLGGELVKSHQELEIANYLYLNGIKYQYEKPYEHKTSSKLHAQYHPDFYLTDYGIYLEHFGVDEHGQTAPFIDSRRYNEEIRWKRDLHREKGTTLVETYSYEGRRGGLQSALERKILDKGVKLNPISNEEVFSKLNELGAVKPISGILATFLNLYKSNNMELAEIQRRAAASITEERNASFLSIFKEIYSEYEKELASEDAIDFSDMINQSTKLVETGVVKQSYRYVMVDEFQDLSRSRFKLLKAILDSNPNCKLFAVGDDWQSIFRFAGSDLNLMARFEENFGDSKILFVDESFRFNDKICTLSTKFILENPRQIRKQLETRERVSLPAVTLIYTNAPQEEIEDILRHLNERGGTVQILGRYNHSKPTIPHYPNLEAEFLTVHRSKGTEADYVIILDLKSGFYGFPSEVADDPVLQLVLPEPEDYPHAEERRLFYVALTRARKHVFLLADQGKPSTFVTELLKGGYEIELKNEPEATEGICPICGGDILKRNSTNGEFYSCSNYPYCGYKVPRCPSGDGHLLFNGHDYVCDSCRSKYRKCPSCGGALVIRQGPYSRFIGCSNYPECEYKENIR